MPKKFSKALIVGAGAGLSGSLARLFSQQEVAVALAARDIDKLSSLCQQTGARAFHCDAADPKAVDTLFNTLDEDFGQPDLVVYNPSFRVRGHIVELDPLAVKQAIDITAYGAFLVAQAAAKRMLPNHHGCILFTGASAGVKGYPQSAPFAMGKFALRGLAQSMARELHPQGIHVVHAVIDGGIRNSARKERTESKDTPDTLLDPDAIADTYWHLTQQDRSIWSWEIALRPWVEKF